MALIDIAPAQLPAATSTLVAKRGALKEALTVYIVRFSDYSLDHPLAPALAFGFFLHFCLLLVYLAAHNGSSEGYWPHSGWHALAWLPEFVLPYLALRFFSVAQRSSHRSWNSKVKEGLDRTRELQKVSILGFAKISEVRDADTGDHILRMSHYSRMLAEEMGRIPEYKEYVTREYCEEIFLSAPLHDIGKVGILDNILKKRGPLTVDEFEIMKMHTILGGDLLNELELKLGFRTFYSLGKQIAYHHHQRFDGTGYPNVLGASKAMFLDAGIGKPLAGKDIPLSARIVALADVYDALVSRRCYKEPMSHETARGIILQDSAKRFDPDLVRAFLRIEKDIIHIAKEFNK